MGEPHKVGLRDWLRVCCMYALYIIIYTTPAAEAVFISSSLNIFNIQRKSFPVWHLWLHRTSSNIAFQTRCLAPEMVATWSNWPCPLQFARRPPSEGILRDTCFSLQPKRRELTPDISRTSKAPELLCLVPPLTLEIAGLANFIAIILQLFGDMYPVLDHETIIQDWPELLGHWVFFFFTKHLLNRMLSFSGSWLMNLCTLLYLSTWGAAGAHTSNGGIVI